MDTLQSKIEQYMDQENLHRTEGRRGLENLCKLCRAIGYKDPQYFGQLTQEASVGDLMDFLEDNSGAIEALIEWMGNQRSAEWGESLSALVPRADEHKE